MLVAAFTFGDPASFLEATDAGRFVMAGWCVRALDSLKGRG